MFQAAESKQITGCQPYSDTSRLTQSKSVYFLLSLHGLRRLVDQSWKKTSKLPTRATLPSGVFIS